MVALQRIIPQNEADAGFGLLKDIVALAKNPNAIAEAHEEMRKQAALTEEETAKYAEARAFILRSEERKKALEEAEAGLEKQKNEHQATIEKYGESVQKDNERFNEWESRLKQKEEDLQKISDGHKTEKEEAAKLRQEAESYRDSILADANIAKASASDLLLKAKDTYEEAAALKAKFEAKIKNIQAALSDDVLTHRNMPFGV